MSLMPPLCEKKREESTFLDEENFTMWCTRPSNSGFNIRKLVTLALIESA